MSEVNLNGKISSNSREFIEQPAHLLEERRVRSHSIKGEGKPQTSSPEIPNFQNATESERYKKLTSMMPSRNRIEEHQRYQKEIGILAIDALYEKIDQAQKEPDPGKRAGLLIEAQSLMTEYFNLARDPSMNPRSREAMVMNLRYYTIQCKRLAPNYPDLAWVQGAGCTSYESYSRLEKIVRDDPGLKVTYENWQQRQKSLYS